MSSDLLKAHIEIFHRSTVKISLIDGGGDCANVLPTQWNTKMNIKHTHTHTTSFLVWMFFLDVCSIVWWMTNMIYRGKTLLYIRYDIYYGLWSMKDERCTLYRNRFTFFTSFQIYIYIQTPYVVYFILKHADKQIMKWNCAKSFLTSTIGFFFAFYIFALEIQVGSCTTKSKKNNN